MSEQNYRFAADPFVNMFELVFKGRWSENHLIIQRGHDSVNTF